MLEEAVGVHLYPSREWELSRLGVPAEGIILAEVCSSPEC